MSRKPVNAKCSREFFPAYHNEGPRSRAQIKWIVLHDEEASTARGAAEYFQSPKSGGSAHLCVDGKECYRCVSDLVVAEGAANANTPGLHIEHAGYASWIKRYWVLRIWELRRSAYKAAVWCREYDIPAVFVDHRGLAAGQRGITTHAEVSLYSIMENLPGDHSHTDPGKGFPMGMYILMVRYYIGRIRAGTI